MLSQEASSFVLGISFCLKLTLTLSKCVTGAKFKTVYCQFTVCFQPVSVPLLSLLSPSLLTGEMSSLDVLTSEFKTTFCAGSLLKSLL
jgi:hypothetical protein